MAIKNIIQLESSKDSNCKIAVKEYIPDTDPLGIILFMHGATIPSVVYEVANSWSNIGILEYVKNLGYAVYSLDYRGYGLSSKPKAMDLEPVDGEYLIDHKDACQDILDVIELIKSKHGKDVPIYGVGFSWGSGISAYTQTQYSVFKKLVLLGPVYSYNNPHWESLADPKDITKINPSIKNYRVSSRKNWCALWEKEASSEFKQSEHFKNIKNLIEDYIEESDKEWAVQNNMQQSARIPTGVLKDAFSVFSRKPLYEAPAIKCPVMILRGTLDTASVIEDMEGLMEKLTCEKKLVNIENSTHYGMLEENGKQFIDEIIFFFNNE